MPRRVTIDDKSYADLERLARKYDTDLDGALRLALRALRQRRMGEELAAPLTRDESAWLSADLG